MSYTINTDYKAKYYGNLTGKKKYIVVHYTANPGLTATAKANANYFKNSPRKASADYVVDENPIIYQCVPDGCSSYAVGDDQKYTNGGASMKGVVKNSNSISIEMVSHSDASGYYIPDATIERTVELIRALQKKHGISDVYRHYDVTGKLCPQPLIDSAKWNEFLSKLKEGEEVEADRIKVLMNGKETELDTILYKNENYMKIRDLANAQTDDNLTVDYDSKNKKVIINTK